MRLTAITIIVILCFGLINAQDIDTVFLRHAVSQYDTIGYRRIIQLDKNTKMYHVRDYFQKGQIQMEAFYSSFDRLIKEEPQCNYLTNTKEGVVRAWFQNGQIEFIGNYENGLRDGLTTSWYPDGQKESEENWLNGQLHGRTRYWTKQGDLELDLTFYHGMNQNPKNVHYQYLPYVPKDYDADTLKKWPLIIYLHGGSDRGTELRKLYSSGIPDQIYRGREFPFIVVAPQCPEHIRWSTDNWFDDFYYDVITTYRIDTNRVYLTGFSLGGSGTWYLAVKYPGRFAAIAPMSGFTSNLDFIDTNIEKLIDMPIWAFHGKVDNVVPFEETERIMNKLEGKNQNLRFTIEPNVGHGIHWFVYPGQELYDWFLKYDRERTK